MPTTPQFYEIKIQGHLASRRLRGFEGWRVQRQPSGETLLVGPVLDASALYGLLSWLRDLGVTLLSLQPLEEPGTIEEEKTV